MLLLRSLKRTSGYSLVNCSTAWNRQQCKAVSVALMQMVPFSSPTMLASSFSPLKIWAQAAEMYS